VWDAPAPEVVELGSSVDQIWQVIRDDFTLRRLEGISCPEISGAGVKVQLESLAWRADGNFAQVLGIVLLVLCGDFTGLIRGGYHLLENVLHAAFPTNSLVRAVFTLCVHAVVHLVGTFFRRVELVFME